MLILPDTSCWIEHFRPRGEAVVQAEMRRWLGMDRVALCGPVRAEVVRGARRSEASRILDAFTALTHLGTLERDWKAVEATARRLAEVGHTVPLLDLLIAEIARRHGAILAHRDAHFRPIAEVVPVRTHDFLP